VTDDFRLDVRFPHHFVRLSDDRSKIVRCPDDRGEGACARVGEIALQRKLRCAARPR